MVDIIVSALSALLGGLMEGAVQLILPVFGFNFETFVRAFPFAGTAYDYFQVFAVVAVLLLAAVQLIPFFSYSSQNKSSPIRVAIFTVLAVASIYYGNYILTGIMDIAQLPYNALMDASAEYQLSSIDIGLVFSVINDLTYQISVPLYIVLIIMIGFAFIKLLLEAVERYVILFVLVYLSPLASITLVTEESSGVFRRYITMFISQCILLILNVWSLKMICSLFVGLYDNENKMIALLLGYAFLRIAARLDSYLNSLGLNAAITGAGLGTELFASGVALMSRFNPLGNSGKTFSNNKADGASGGILGISQQLANGIGKVSPIAGAGAAVTNAMGAVGKTVGSSIKAGKEASANGEPPIAAFSEHYKENIGKNMHDASMKTQGQSLWASGFNTVAKQTAARVQAGGAQLTDEHLSDISKNAFLADAAFNAITGDVAINDTNTIGAVMKGMGLEKTEDGEAAVSAAMGAIPTEGFAATLDNKGIHAQYEQDGKTHDWQLMNRSQFSALSVQEQQGYHSFTNANGSTYYYKHNSERAPTAAQKKEANLSDAISSFTADPVNNPLTPQQWSQSRQPGNKHLLNNMMHGFQENGTSLEYSEETKDTCRNALSTWSSTLTDCHVPKKAIKKAEMALLSSDDDSVKAFTVSGNGLHMVCEENGKEIEFGLMNEQGMKDNNVDYSNLRNKGYLPTEINGETYFAFYDERNSEGDEISKKLRRHKI